MTTAQLTLHNEAGLHARPAALFVKLATSFAATITVATETKSANAKSIVNVLVLGAKKGTVITITAEGADEAAAVPALVALIERNFTEA